MENQLITLLRIKTPQVGRFVKDKLEEMGIEVFFTNEGLSLDEKYNPDEVLLKVKAGKSEKAIDTILKLHKEYNLDEIRDDDKVEKMKKILVPVKISKHCYSLCEYAIALAKKQNAEVKILYVYPDPTLNESQRNTTSWEKIVKMELKEAQAKAQLQLVEFSRELKKHVPKELFDSVKVHYRMLKGTPVNVISDASKRYRPDLIVMGTQTPDSEEGEFRGKTLVQVIENSHFPVLAVPQECKFKGKDKLNVMYATDFYDSDNTSLNKLLEILKPYDKKIRCVHIAAQDSTKIKEKVKDLNNMIEHLYSEYDIFCVLNENESVVDGLNKFVKENEIDLISLSKMRHSAFYKLFHNDLVESLVSSECVPMLIFPI